MAKFLVIIALLTQWDIFGLCGMQAPSFYLRMQENKLYSILMIFFLCNAVETQLVSTGAFEISLDNLQVWSKIESGRIPQPPELFQIIDNHLNMNKGSSIGSDDPYAFRDEL